MAQFKFVGHSNGAYPDHKPDTAITVRGSCNFGAPETFEIEVMPDEVFDLSDAWVTAVAGVEATIRNSKPVYQRVA